MKTIALPQWKFVSDEGGSKLTTAILKPIIYYLVLQFSITTNPRLIHLLIWKRIWVKHLFHLVAIAKYYGYNGLFNNCITYLFE